MAFASDSTTAPARPLLPLAPFVFRPSPPVDDPRSAEEVLREIATEIERQAHQPELPPEPLLPAADHARTLHLRRQLAQAAEHGAALLASLGLPRLVTADFIQIDPVAAGDALDLAIATLDALDGDTDIEDSGDDELSLGWEKPGSQFILTEGAYSSDREHDTADAEPSLASPERHPAVPVCFSGGPFTARGGDEGQLRWAEGAHHDGELVNEDGDDLDAGEHDTSDHESYLGWPEDVGAVLSAEACCLTADPDAEHDDVDREDDELGEEHSVEPVVRVFGTSHSEVAHV